MDIQLQTISEWQATVELGIPLNSFSVYNSAFQNQIWKIVLLKNKTITLSGTACYIMHFKKKKKWNNNKKTLMCTWSEAAFSKIQYEFVLLLILYANT